MFVAAADREALLADPAARPRPARPVVRLELPG
jgi:hypothetical protein